jgi:hypothetical protein
MSADDSARRGLKGRLVLMGLSEQAADRAIDAYAHELAEKQRAWNGPPFIEERWESGKSDAADLIDPEVLNSGA